MSSKLVESRVDVATRSICSRQAVNNTASSWKPTCDATSNRVRLTASMFGQNVERRIKCGALRRSIL